MPLLLLVLHEVYSGVCLIDNTTNEKHIESEKTEVIFKKLTDEMIENYLNTGESMDAAEAIEQMDPPASGETLSKTRKSLSRVAKTQHRFSYGASGKESAEDSAPESMPTTEGQEPEARNLRPATRDQHIANESEFVIYWIKNLGPERFEIIKPKGFIQVWICGALGSNIPFPQTILTLY